MPSQRDSAVADLSDEENGTDIPCAPGYQVSRFVSSLAFSVQKRNGEGRNTLWDKTNRRTGDEILIALFC
jgi:hypothetical protein